MLHLWKTLCKYTSIVVFAQAPVHLAVWSWRDTRAHRSTLLWRSWPSLRWFGWSRWNMWRVRRPFCRWSTIPSSSTCEFKPNKLRAVLMAIQVFLMDLTWKIWYKNIFILSFFLILAHGSQISIVKESSYFLTRTRKIIGFWNMSLLLT